MNNEQTLGEWLREIRESRQMTRKEVATRLGCDKQTVWRWEGGHSHISATSLRSLLVCLAVPQSGWGDVLELAR